jgi:FkbM family methyltransferase
VTAARSVLAPLAYRLVTRAPAGAVCRARTTGRLAPLLETGFVALGAPLYGAVVPIAHGPAAGLRLVAQRRSLVWISGRVEQDVQSSLTRFLVAGGTFVDVGASIGFFALLAARLVGPTGAVVAFEPQPEAAASVRRNAELNGFGNVAVVEAALSSRAGDRQLAGVGKATGHLVDQSGNSRPTLRVSCTTLDLYLDERAEVAPDLIKIDVEGHEGAVLDGMHDTLVRRRPVLLIECHADVQSLLPRLQDARYAVSVLGSNQPVSEASGSVHLLAEPEERC